jgi:hypothetical protein
MPRQYTFLEISRTCGMIDLGVPEGGWRFMSMADAQDRDTFRRWLDKEVDQGQRKGVETAIRTTLRFFGSQKKIPGRSRTSNGLLVESVRFGPTSAKSSTVLSDVMVRGQISLQSSSVLRKRGKSGLPKTPARAPLGYRRIC